MSVAITKFVVDFVKHLHPSQSFSSELQVVYLTLLLDVFNEKMSHVWKFLPK